MAATELNLCFSVFLPFVTQSPNPLRLPTGRWRGPQFSKGAAAFWVLCSDSWKDSFSLCSVWLSKWLIKVSLLISSVPFPQSPVVKRDIPWYGTLDCLQAALACHSSCFSCPSTLLAQSSLSQLLYQSPRAAHGKVSCSSTSSCPACSFLSQESPLSSLSAF